MRIKDIETKQLFEIETKKSHGEELMMCPKCSPTRKKSKEKCFSWNIDKMLVIVVTATRGLSSTRLFLRV